MRVSLLLLALLLAACDDQPKQSNENTGTASTNINAGGDVSTCNPTFSGNLQNTTVKIECGPGIPPAALAKLEAYLTEQQRSSKNLNDLIDQQRKAIIDWEKKYRDQEANLREALALMPNDQLLQAAQLALQQGDLEKAANLLEQRFQQWEEKATTKLATEAFQVGKAYQLAFKPLQALPYLEKAHRYQPGDFDYGFAYAVALQNQNQRREAEAVYQDLLKAARADTTKPDRVAKILNNLAILAADDTSRRGEAEGQYQEALKVYRSLAQDNPKGYLPDVAMTLNNLAVLVDDDTRRRGEAEGYYQEALKIRRLLAQDNPAVFMQYVATTLNNLAALVAADTSRRGEAEGFYQEALKIRRQLAQDNPKGYLPDVAMTLNNLALLVADDTRRRGEAEGYYQEALKVYRLLAQDNPAVYLPDVARTLNNLAVLVNDDTSRRGEAEGYYQEALKIRRPLAQNNPAVYLPYVANTLYALGLAQLEWQDKTQARISLQEAADLLRPFAQQAPGVFGDKQASILFLLAGAGEDAQRACQTLEEALGFAQAEGLKADIAKAHAACDTLPAPAKPPATRRQR